MIQSIRRKDLNNIVVGLAVLFIGLVSVWLFPAPDAARGLSSYVPLHTIMEVVAIAIAAMVFGVSWATHRFQPNGRALILGLGFLGVALFDLTHALSYAGMPNLITPSGPEKAINFWLAARLLAGLAFVWVAFWPSRVANFIGRQSEYWGLSIILLLVGCVHFVLIVYPSSIPRTYIDGQGLTPFKINFEYGLIALYLIAGYGFLKRWWKKQESGDSLLAMASFTMAMSEFFFTLYANVTDIYNVAGHLYKIIAFGFVYRALFLETIRQPYQSLQRSEAKYIATLDTLPDLLFEVNRDGVYQSVHARTESKLAAPTSELIGKRLDEVLPVEAAAVSYEALAEADRNNTSRGHRISLKVPDGHKHFELSVSKKPPADGDTDHTFLVLSRDITETVENENHLTFQSSLNSALLELQERESLEQESDFLERWLAYSKSLTHSSIAFVYAVRDNQQSLQFLACSNNGIHPCTHAHDAVDLDLAQLGRWADAVRLKQIILINTDLKSGDTAGIPINPSGIKNLLALPVMEGNRVQLVVGIADKAEHFTEQEAKALQVMSVTLWSMLKQIRKDAVINQLSEALEQSPHAIVMTDTSARIQYVNRAFSEASGYSPQEAIGKNPKILQSGETDPTLYEALWKRLTQGQSWQGEFINRKKNGQHFVELVSVYPISDRFGKLTHYVAHKIDVTQHKVAEKRIRDLSEFDSLTGLHNRKSFQYHLNAALDHAAQTESSLTLLWLNLDNFKTINESLGHSVGDELLIEMANRIVHSLGVGATVARHGGDTFVAIIPTEKQSLIALKVRELLNKIQSPLLIDNQKLSLSASAGIAIYPDDAKAAGPLASAAEIAMYRAKQDGRNNLRFFSSDLQEHTQRSLELAVSLKDAQDRGELFLVYQPQKRLSDQKIIGAEVLLRWQHPKFGLISPAEFIPIAEQTGLIVPIGLWVIEQAARQLRAWDLIGLEKIFVAVNVSAIQFARPGFVEELMKVMSSIEVSTHRIEIEITEAVALKNADQAGLIIHQLHAAGFAVALDDFGTGYSSLSYLKRYAIDRLKIDQSFVKDLATNTSDQAIVNAIIHMAHSLQMTTIAEGVESQEQAKLLHELGCDEIQGYWFSKPLVSQDFEKLLRAEMSHEPS